MSLRDLVASESREMQDRTSVFDFTFPQVYAP
jgi:hypothetical protein